MFIICIRISIRISVGEVPICICICISYMYTVYMSAWVYITTIVVIIDHQNMRRLNGGVIID
jgi:hypothetical protein